MAYSAVLNYSALFPRGHVFSPRGQGLSPHIFQKVEQILDATTLDFNNPQSHSVLHEPTRSHIYPEQHLLPGRQFLHPAAGFAADSPPLTRLPQRASAAAIGRNSSVSNYTTPRHHPHSTVTSLCPNFTVIATSINSTLQPSNPVKPSQTEIFLPNTQKHTQNTQSHRKTHP